MFKRLTPAWNQLKRSLAVLFALSLFQTYSIDCLRNSSRKYASRIGHDYYSRRYDSVADRQLSLGVQRADKLMLDCMDPHVCGKVPKIWDAERRGILCVGYNRPVSKRAKYMRAAIKHPYRNNDDQKWWEKDFNGTGECAYDTKLFVEGGFPAFGAEQGAQDEIIIENLIPSNVRVDITYSNGFKGKTNQCGGVLVDREWVLTAGHCLNETNFGQVINILLRIGATTASDLPPKIFISKAYQWVYFEKWKRQSSFDLALIKLPQPVNYTTNIQPACCELDDALYEEAKLYTPTFNGVGAFAGKMKINQMKICNEQDPPNVSQRHWCIISYNPFRPEAPCRGDAGTGLFAIHRFFKPIKGTRMYVVGVNSLGPQICDGNRKRSYAMMLSPSRDLFEVMLEQASRGNFEKIAEPFRLIDFVPP